MPVGPLRWEGAQAHARRFLEWLGGKGYGGGFLLAGDLKQLHLQMCREIGWFPRPWNSIGAALRTMTSDGKKIYARIGGRRVRVYPVPVSIVQVASSERVRAAA
jgi:hypothetical protein